jgi:hypothetical protein
MTFEPYLRFKGNQDTHTHTRTFDTKSSSSGCSRWNQDIQFVTRPFVECTKVHILSLLPDKKVICVASDAGIINKSERIQFYTIVIEKMALLGRAALSQCLGMIFTTFALVMTTDAFTVQQSSGKLLLKRATGNSIQWSVPFAPPSIICRLSANTDEGTEQEASTKEEGIPEASDASDGPVSEVTAAPEPEQLPTVEDPAIAALKEEIAKLELDVRSSRRQLANINDEAEEFTKTGYTRKVAEMENMRRARSVSVSM